MGAPRIVIRPLDEGGQALGQSGGGEVPHLIKAQWKSSPPRRLLPEQAARQPRCRILDTDFAPLVADFCNKICRKASIQRATEMGGDGQSILEDRARPSLGRSFGAET